LGEDGGETGVIFLFLNQPIKNKIPIKKAIPANCMAQDNKYHSNWPLFNNMETIWANPARIKTIPPTISYFQEINRTINKINTGILWINSPNIVCQKLSSEEKTSKDIKARKMRNIIDRILGVQYTNLLIFLGIFWDRG